MRTWATAAVIVLIALAPAGAADKPKDLIIGKWHAKEDKAFVVEFTKDGKLTISGKEEGKKIEGSYKFLDDDTIELTMERKGEKKTEKQKVKIVGDEMTFNEPGKTDGDVFKRVK